MHIFAEEEESYLECLLEECILSVNESVLSEDKLCSLMAESIQFRLDRLHDILVEVAERGELTHWQVVDMSLVTLAAILEERGIIGLTCRVL